MAFQFSFSFSISIYFSFRYWHAIWNIDDRESFRWNICCNSGHIPLNILQETWSFRIIQKILYPKSSFIKLLHWRRFIQNYFSFGLNHDVIKFYMRFYCYRFSRHVHNYFDDNSALFKKYPTYTKHDNNGSNLNNLSNLQAKLLLSLSYFYNQLSATIYRRFTIIFTLSKYYFYRNKSSLKTYKR